MVAPSGLFRSAATAKGGTLMGLFKALQDEAADTGRGFLRGIGGHAKPVLGIKIGIDLSQSQAALRNVTDPSPGGDLPVSISGETL
jgi:hypothetical protein